MNVFLREIRAYRKSTLIWAASLGGLVLMFMGGMLPAFTRDVEASKNLIGQLPEAVRAAFNIQVATFFTVYGFYGYLLNFATVAGAIMAMNLGTGVISKEVSGKTADFLLSKPITRPKVITAKLTAALVAILFTSAVFAVVGYFASLAASDTPVDAKTFFLMSLTFFLIQLLFLALGAFFAVILPKVKSVIAVTLPTVFAFFIIGTLGEVLGQDKVRYLSPFRFYDTTYIIKNVSLEGTYLIFEAVLVVVAIVAVYVIYARKDVRAAI
jgi:beta-exotoxin I transport system permease protein